VVSSVRSAPPPPPRRSVHGWRVAVAVAGLVFGALITLGFLQTSRSPSDAGAVRSDVTPYFLVEPRPSPQGPASSDLDRFDHNAAFRAIEVAARDAADRCLPKRAPGGVVINTVFQPSGRPSRMEVLATLGGCFTHELGRVWIAPFDGVPTSMTAYVRLR
jgi:hypothetical protein